MNDVDIIGEMCSYLTGIVGVPVVGQLPSPRPDRFVYLDRAGGDGGLAYDEPLINVETWSGVSKADAYRLARQVRDHILRHLPPVIGGIRVTRHTGVGGPSYQPPTTSGAYRYRWTIRVRHQLVKENQ